MHSSFFCCFKNLLVGTGANANRPSNAARYCAVVGTQYYDQQEHFFFLVFCPYFQIVYRGIRRALTVYTLNITHVVNGLVLDKK